MSKRTAEWMEEFWHVLSTVDGEVKELILDGSIEVCPVCGELSAYCWADTTAYDDDQPIHVGMRLERGTIGHIGTSSCWEWGCPHCGADCTDASSPLNHPAYNHSDD